MSLSLEDLFHTINSGQQIPTVLDSEPPLIRRHHGLSNALLKLKQRINPGKEGRELVQRLRVERVPRERPVRNIARTSRLLTTYGLDIASLAPQHDSFSAFQTEGWTAMKQAIDKKESLVLLAPTGSGKSEVFILPIVDQIARGIQKSAPPHWLMIYPRVELLRDQLSRILLAVHHAEARYFSGTRKIIIGMQFSGIKSDTSSTLKTKELFDENKKFLKLTTCPVCDKNQPGDIIYRKGKGGDLFHCTKCPASWLVSISKKSHRTNNKTPHIMVTTAESLDRFYLDPNFTDYLQTVSGFALDEAHLYYGIYGAHIHHVFKRVNELRGNIPLTRIASSATIVEPERFVAKLLGVKEVKVHDASSSRMEHSGDEYAYFVQAANKEDGLSHQNPALIQTIMLLGHGLFKKHERILAFVDSVDQTARFEKTVSDAEVTRKLWELRTLDSKLKYKGVQGPCESAESCPIFKSGECWRGLHTPNCSRKVSGFRDTEMEIVEVSRNRPNDYLQGDVVIATPVLEVGVDDSRILATVHYQAPITGVHGFIQRRGRAGRKVNSDAYTVMVLGQSPTEQYYFYRRHRLLYGKYMLPLNPDNPVIKQMHDKLAEARNCIALRMSKSNETIRPALHHWIIAKLKDCRILNELYEADLDALDSGDHLITNLRAWWKRERPVLRGYLELRAIIREVRVNLPNHPDIKPRVDAALAELDAYEVGKSSKDAVKQKLGKVTLLLTELVTAGITIEGTAAQVYRDKFEALINSLHVDQDLRIAFAEQLHDFFEKLSEFDDGDGIKKGWKINSTADSIKIILQALYFLHLGNVCKHEGKCLAAIEVLVPNSYFGETKLIVVDAQGTSQSNLEPIKKAENINFLASILLPYGLTTRYFKSGNHLGTIDVTPEGIAEKSEDDRMEIKLNLSAQGIRRDDKFEPQKVKVRPLKASLEGNDVVRMCPVCMRLHSITAKRSCHPGELMPVKIYPQAIVYHDYDEPRHRYQFSENFSLAEEIRTSTTVEGSEVTYVKCVGKKDGDISRYEMTKEKESFTARYVQPLSYGITTAGILWNAQRLVKQLMGDAQLHRQVEKIQIEKVPQKLTATLILNTAGNLLLRAVVAIAGVNANNLAFKANVEDLEVCVWETIEGGSGIAQVFMNILRTSPFEVYREFLALALCPVYFAEVSPAVPRTELAERVTRTWHLPANDRQLNGLLDDIASEQAALASADLDGKVPTCSVNDGCPACVQSTVTGKKREREQRASHFVAVAIVRSFLQQLNSADFSSTMVAASQASRVPPQQLTLPDEEGKRSVLIL